ncbi:MAG: ferrous iron transport protein B [Eubacteriales bacterium]|nr:ferrous iron transport protein B [Eubacteriales bacterium]MDD4460880.1 ferrous iron transport protein B [Eubacteriales bacterium]
MSIRIALAGNPNSGKTTLFNRLTGARQTTGNWPGVTVEKKVGYIRRHHQELMLIDLPGIYSLSPYSLEEIVTRNYIVEEKPDVVVNIIDATNLERNLYFTLQLKKLGRPMVIALNMMDEILSHGDQLDVDLLAQRLAVPVIPISARKGEGMDELMAAIRHVTRLPEHPGQGRHRHGRRARYGRGRGENTAWPEALPHHHSQPVNADSATDRLSSGPAVSDGPLPDPSIDLQHRFAAETPEETERMYHLAAEIHDQVLHHSHRPGALSRSDRIDRLLTHRFLAIPLFLLVMFLVFQITFHESMGGRLTGLLEQLFDGHLSPLISRWLTAAQAPGWIESLLIDGIISGVGGVLSFLPQIALLFLFLTLLEDTGYMARAAFIMDKIFEKFGLSGRSFIPMMMGFGCTVPAVMATRTLENERDRRLTIMVIPFMSCGARMPIYAFFASMFFATGKGLVTFSMYIMGIAVAILSAFILSRTVLRGQDAPFIIELPPYRLPDRKSLFLHVWDKVRDFIVRAGTLIFAMTIVVWFFQSFDFSFRMVEDSSLSILGKFGGLVAVLLRPLGYGTWQAAVALLTGLIAKETVVATLEILYTPDTLLASFTPLSAYAFMTFTLLYTPCLAAVAAIKREMASWRWTGLTLVYQIGVAYLFSLLVYQGGRLVQSLL